VDLLTMMIWMEQLKALMNGKKIKEKTYIKNLSTVLIKILK